MFVSLLNTILYIVNWNHSNVFIQTAIKFLQALWIFNFLFILDIWTEIYRIDHDKKSIHIFLNEFSLYNLKKNFLCFCFEFGGEQMLYLFWLYLLLLELFMHNRSIILHNLSIIKNSFEEKLVSNIFYVLSFSFSLIFNTLLFGKKNKCDYFKYSGCFVIPVNDQIKVELFKIQIIRPWRVEIFFLSHFCSFFYTTFFNRFIPLLLIANAKIHRNRSKCTYLHVKRSTIQDLLFWFKIKSGCYFLNR